jgi:hypothetical protein
MKPGASASEKLFKRFRDTYDKPFCSLQEQLQQEPHTQHEMFAAVEKHVDEKLAAEERLPEICNIGWIIHESSYNVLLEGPDCRALI